VERAVEVFVLQSRVSASRLVDATWWARSEPVSSFISVAAAHWEMVVTRQRGAVWLTVRGPETRATAMPIPQDAEFFGITFSVGTFMPKLPPGRLVDRAVTLVPASRDSVRLDGRVLVVPWRECWCTIRWWPTPCTGTSPASRPGRWSAGWLGRPG
jgi:hypothetical protein